MKNALIPSVLLSSVVFAGLTLPLAAAGSQPLEIKLQKEQVFIGTLRDIATPYLGLAGLISVGAGMINLSVSGWRNSSRKSIQMDERVSKLQKELQQKETQIEDLRLSVPYLKATGLDAFLEPHPGSKEQNTSSDGVLTPALEVVHPTIQQQVPPVVQPQIAKATASPIHQSLAIVDSSESALPTIHTSAIDGAITSASTAQEEMAVNHAEVVIAQMHELKQQLQQMTAQVAMLQQQNMVQAPPPAPKPIQQESPISSGQIIEHLHRRLQHLESDWLRQKVAS